jgi:cyanophycin synthetase
MVAAARRVPAHVVGDGELNLQQLIDKENKDPRRGYGHENVLTEIEVDKDTLELLEKLQYTLETVPQRGEVVYLKSTANLSTGGTSIDVTDMVHRKISQWQKGFPKLSVWMFVGLILWQKI